MSDLFVSGGFGAVPDAALYRYNIDVPSFGIRTHR